MTSLPSRSISHFKSNIDSYTTHILVCSRKDNGLLACTVSVAFSGGIIADMATSTKPYFNAYRVEASRFF